MMNNDKDKMGMTFVNPKQYHRIMIRRQEKVNLNAKYGITSDTQKKPYLNESRHEMAKKRVREGGRFAKQAPDPNNPNGSTPKKAKSTPAKAQPLNQTNHLITAASPLSSNSARLSNSNSGPPSLVAPNNLSALPMANYLDLPHWAQLRDYKPQYTFNKGVYSFNAYNSYNSLDHFPSQNPVQNNNGALISNRTNVSFYVPTTNNTNNAMHNLQVDMSGNGMVIDNSNNMKLSNSNNRR